jgi:hypothetical protein
MLYWAHDGWAGVDCVSRDRLRTREEGPLQYVLALGLRGGIGFIFGVIFGIAGLAFTFWILPDHYILTKWLLVLATGSASGVAGGLAFLNPESGWRVMATGFALASFGGMAGAWLGYQYGQLVYSDSVWKTLLVFRSVRSPAAAPSITFASLFSVGFGGVYYGFRAWRHHEV